jgi:hypothetical protein
MEHKVNAAKLECILQPHTVENHLRYKRICDPGSFKDNGAVVEEVVSPSELLKHLQGHSECNA